jgi:hypothetical protein
MRDNLNFGCGKKSEVRKEPTPVDRPIHNYLNLSKNLNIAEGKRRQVVGMESPS